jgi:hypothetical protein
MHTVEVPHLERFREARGWGLAGLFFAGLCLWATLAQEKFAEYWWVPTAVLLVFYGPGAYYVFRRRKRVITPDAAKAKSYYVALTNQLKAAKPARDGLIEQTVLRVEQTVLRVYEGTLIRIFRRRGARYVLAVAAFTLAGYLLHYRTSNDAFVWAGLLAIAGALLALDALLWLLGAGIVIGLFVALFKGIAALPVSVAVIIGALIIASAVSNKK